MATFPSQAFGWGPTSDVKNMIGKQDRLVSLVGDYAIVASAAQGTGLDNYTISYVDGKLTVDPKVLTITASDRTKTYGDTVTFAGTAFTPSGLVNSDTVNSVGLSSTGAVATATVGDYAIVASAAQGTGLDNYTISYVDGKLTVDPKGLTITASDRTKTYGDTVTFAGTAFTPSGLINSDTVNSVGLSSTGAVATATVGDYAIVASAAQGTGLDNYTISYVDGKLTVDPKALTITADAKSKTYGGADPTLTYQITSGSFVTGDRFSGAPARAAGENVGNYAIDQGSLTAGGNYVLTFLAADFTITKGVLQVTASDRSKTYGQALGSGDFSGTITGLVNGDTVTATYGSTGADGTASVAGGPYPITAALVDPQSKLGNYDVTTQDGSLTVDQAPVTVTAVNQSKTYDGQAFTAFTVSYAGFAAGDGPSELGGALSFSGTAVGAKSHDTYSITPWGLTSSNYALAFANGTLTINQASLTITANNASMFQGTAVPPLSVSYSGFVNGDSSASLSRQPTVSTPATPLSPAATYPIVVGGASSPNYAINYASGVLVVTPAPVRVLKVSIQAVRLGKTKKTTQVIVLQFTGALNAGNAQRIGNCSLATIPSNKKQKSKAVALSQATYNPANNTVRLVTRRPLVLNPPLKLTVYTARVLDTLGRPLDGDDDGAPGGNFVGTLRKLRK